MPSICSTTDARREACRRGGRARAAQFTSESQAAAQAGRSYESLSTAGKKGAQVTIARHGYETFVMKTRQRRLEHPSAPERKLMGILADLGFTQYEREFFPFGGADLTVVDFAFPETRKIIEVEGGVHRVAAFDPDGKREYRAQQRLGRLVNAGWEVMVLSDEELGSCQQALKEFLG